MKHLRNFNRIAALSGLIIFARTPLPAAEFTLENDQVVVTCSTKDGELLPGALRDKKTGQTVQIGGGLFSVTLASGNILRSAEFKLVGDPQVAPTAPNPAASRRAEQLPGKELIAELKSADGNLSVTWRAVLRDGSRYFRQEFTFTAGQQEIPWTNIGLLDLKISGAHSTGKVDGSPVATDSAFFGAEHPLSINRAETDSVRCSLPRGASLLPGESYSGSSVVGFVGKGQLRRDFLAYLERERAHPYRPFLHYNSWYDIGYFGKYDEKAALNVINAFGQELTVKRGVKLDSFLFDDGWDDYSTLWQFDKTNFPNGFAPIQVAAAKYGAAPGIWLSPWGGYGAPHDQRLKFGQAQGFEIRNGKFSMAGPKYYERFRGLCVDVVNKYGINQFKFDGIGQNTGRGGGGAQRDFDAMLKLIGELRTLKPDIYCQVI